MIFNHDEFLSYWETSYGREASAVQLKGFRPGTAPKELLDKAIDKDEVFNKAASLAVRDALKEITQENSWEIIDQPRVEILESDTGLKFKATLIVFPEVVLGNYKKIAKSVLSDKKEVKIEQDEVDKTIDWVLKSRAQIIRVGREAKKGDIVEINLDGNKDKFVLGEGQMRDGLEDKIVGHKESDKFDGVELVGVYDRKAPELNDDFVRSIGKFNSVEEFKNSIKEGILKEKQDKEIEKNRLRILSEIIKSAKIDMPEILVDKTLENMVHEYRHYMEHMKNLKNRPSEEDLNKRLKPEAEKRVASELIINQIAKEEHLEPITAEVEAEVNTFLKSRNNSEASKIDPRRVYDYSYDIIKNKKVFEFLESV
ncbi:MAG: trigger factor [Parcubacteria group bacterium Athens0714_26]|nr:MAG: trigger factor [Parcubacteria group bacterium Athens1014_26]TSD03691.1 MAG: trigger factor [Parcubacteria group bacterium Athens0714_26]